MVVQIVLGILSLLLSIYLIVLWARLGLDLVQAFSRSWRPRGALLVVAESVYTVTDPPIKLFRRLIPPLRIGPVALDLGFPLTMLLCFVLLSIARTIMLL